MLIQTEDPIEDEYPRRPKKFFKPTLKGELNKRILIKWIKEFKLPSDRNK
jgi:hypothetical protein